MAETKERLLFHGMFNKKAASCMSAKTAEKVFYNLAYIKGIADYALACNKIDQFLYNTVETFIKTETEIVNEKIALGELA